MIDTGREGGNPREIRALCEHTYVLSRCSGATIPSASLLEEDRANREPLLDELPPNLAPAVPGLRGYGAR